MNKNLAVAILIVICIAAGFIAGRKTVSYDTEIRYVKGEAVHDTVFQPVPFIETIHDTIRLVERDTVLTLIDWNTERHYMERLFDDNTGTLDVSAMVQYNRLQHIAFDFVPVHKEIIRYKQPVWQPYAVASFSSLNTAGVGAGIFYKNIGIEYQYRLQQSGSRTEHQFGLKWKLMRPP